jgi:NAD(P)-dependent dehydrogenase (short-subunit alcohol dehydrogenase family)
MTDICGRIAFITGGANGIGLGIARSLAGEGAKLALVDLDAEALDRAHAELSGSTQVFTAVLDVRDRDAYEKVADAVETELGPVSILVNNAGVSGGAVVHKLTYELWDWGIGINLTGVFNGIRTFVPRMVARGAGGHVVNTASGRGLVPPMEAGSMLYTTAKYAVVGMSEALRIDLESKHIGVSVLCPGPVATDIIARASLTRPRPDGPVSSEQAEKVTARADYLANGLSPDSVGDMVRDAIRENQLYIHTHPQIADLIRRRTQALLDAVPT